MKCVLGGAARRKMAVLLWSIISELVRTATNWSLITHIEVDNSDDSITLDNGWMQEDFSVQDNSFDLWGIIVNSNLLVFVASLSIGKKTT